MPPLPKDPSVRRRQNRSSTARRLSTVHDVKAPRLPTRKPAWLKATRDWWADVWSSPMAPEYTDADIHGLVLLAMLVDQFHRTPTAGLAAEIRLQRQCFGLTPIDRRRLQWEIDRGEVAETRTRSRRNSTRPQAADAPDPRLLLSG